VGNICHDGWGTKEPRKDGDFIFRPTQVNIVLVPPGQDLPLHQDNQWYWGVNQLSQPDWLLHSIKESRLYDDQMIPQAQGNLGFAKFLKRGEESIWGWESFFQPIRGELFNIPPAQK
jgi:hypothetical protein